MTATTLVSLQHFLCVRKSISGKVYPTLAAMSDHAAKPAFHSPKKSAMTTAMKNTITPTTTTAIGISAAWCISNLLCFFVAYVDGHAFQKINIFQRNDWLFPRPENR